MQRVSRHMNTSLTEAAVAVLMAADPAAKVTLSRRTAAAWRDGTIVEIGAGRPPDRPARLAEPRLGPPRDLPRRRITANPEGRIALLHALAHIELNAIDLAWDIIARFAGEDLPRAFYDDWVQVADEEAHHHDLLSRRLEALGSHYGAQAAHDGLWQAAQETAHDLLARLAVVPLVLEARGLDVTPPMIEKLQRAGDPESAAILEVIYRDEIGHVAIGKRWFDRVAQGRELEPRAAWQNLVRRHFKGTLKPPFNDAGRAAADFPADFYGPLVADRS